ncbi:Hypothetical predicted protein [Paramuricea clavata]|uniref:Uncharacterized protein n=1 Tax=Paramuricea clavata TaxID=317549 RepID=A0A7D9J6I2_PARCT|nr:Hypothetical predicted protein [Paramuricea clavata]
MTTTGFAVVEFVEEKSVEIICEKWIETCDGVMYSYWPQLNAKGKAKKAVIPDKELWKKYKIRVLSYTDNFKTAQKRKRSRPGSYHYAELSECYDGNETDNVAHEENLTRPALTPLLPAAPMFPVTSSPGLNRNGDFSAALISAVNTVFDSTPSDVSCGSRPLLSSIPCTSTSSPNYSNSQRQHQNVLTSLNNASSVSRPVHPSIPCTPISTPNYSNSYRQHQNGLNKSTTSLNNQNPVLTHNGKSSSTRQDQQDNFHRCVLTKLDIMIEKQDEGLSILRMLLGATSKAILLIQM